MFENTMKFNVSEIETHTTQGEATGGTIWFSDPKAVYVDNHGRIGFKLTGDDVELLAINFAAICRQFGLDPNGFDNSIDWTDGTYRTTTTPPKTEAEWNATKAYHGKATA